MNISFYDGKSWKTRNLNDVLALPEADRNNISNIKIESNIVNVPDFSQPLQRGGGVALKQGYAPVAIGKGIFTSSNFPNLEVLDLGDGKVAQIEDGALANLPKLKRLNFRGALDQNSDKSPEAKFSVGAFVDKSLDDKNRTKLNIPVMVGFEKATGNGFNVSLSDLITKQCLKQPVQGLKSEYITDENGYVEPVVVEPKESKFMEMLKGQRPFRMGALGAAIGGVGYAGFVAIATLVSGAGAIAILPVLGKALLDIGIGAGVGLAISQLPLLRRLTKAGRVETAKRKIQRQKEKARKREEKYNQNINKCIMAKRNEKRAIAEYFSSNGISGLIKKPISKLKEANSAFMGNVYRDRALKHDRIMSKNIEKAGIFQEKIEDIENRTGKSYSHNGIVEAFRERQREVEDASATFGKGSSQEKDALLKYKVAHDAVMARPDGENIINAANSSEKTMKTEVQAMEKRAEKTREKGVSKANDQGIDLTR